MNDKVFIICIELNNIRAIETFENLLSSMGIWINITLNTYAIKQDSSVTSNNLKMTILNELSRDCRVFVMKTSIDASWNLPANIDGWVKSYI